MEENGELWTYLHCRMSEVPSKIATRMTNASKHPGEHQNRYNRKSARDAQAEREQKEAEKRQKQKKKEAGMRKAAALEKEAQWKAMAHKKNVGVPAETRKPIERAYRRPEQAKDVNDSQFFFFFRFG